MTFDTTEKSVESGKPLEYYKFDFGTESFNRTSHDEDVTFQGVLYTGTQLSHTPVKSSNEDEVNAVDITLPTSDVMAQKFTNIIPGKRILVDIFKTHRSEIGGTEESYVTFRGYIASVRFVGSVECVFKCKPFSDIFRQTGPRYMYSILCNHTHYDARCKVDRSLFQFDGTVTAISSDVITVNGATAKGADFFEGGFAELPAGAGDDFRLIVQQTGDDMRLLLPFADTSILNKTVRLFAGCKRDLTTCNVKFSNEINFGGSPYVPPKNPFTISELR